MSTLRWIFGAWLGLIALHALAATKAAPKRVGQVFSAAEQLVERLLDPNVPAIPDLREER